MLSLVHSLIKLASPSHTIYTLSAVTVMNGKEWYNEPIEPVQSYRDVEERWEQTERPKPHGKSVVPE